MATTSSTTRCLLVALALAAIGSVARAGADAAATVHLDALTWVELRERIAAGATIALVPIGGTEQNGPHMVLGKHNARARWLAERIAQRLGNALVAPVVAYVPEGAIDPPAAHMRWPGTLSMPGAAFESMLEATALSLARAGFRDVVLLGDHGGYLGSLDHVAARVNGAKRTPPVHVHALGEYYRASSSGFDQMLRERGFSDAQIGRHAGLSDTALALAVDEALVRPAAMAAAPVAGNGVQGDPRRATAELGRAGLELIVEASVAAIRQRTRRGQ
ncbi:MAG: creatininase family protein [Aquincola sp.]|nr:creatininase family protein [Aquincola sp.]